ncbi:hypothetical protein OsJ_26785 [Oryza sativa Japonica Group]|uniref:Disease resistance N-terminal domain-containing protein n=1 Tax=Oryza sativa subsp. japonica TaxID=39947 RepID=A3BRN1_ORYSJ|nr:hypothetical protein OsJ_26785 [Oryza sativa Japonica Group]
MAKAVVLPLVSKLQEVALSEGRALVGVGGEINRLRDKLMWLMAFLQEADPQRRAADAGGELMRVLVHQTRDAAFSAEDALDDYARPASTCPATPGWSRAAVGFLAGITTQLRVRHRLSSDIAAIHARFEEIVGNKDKYRLEGSAPSSLLTWTASAASSSESILCLKSVHAINKEDELEFMGKNTARLFLGFND